MGIISADVVHNISTPKHGAKVAAKPAKKYQAAAQTLPLLVGLLKVS
jgi:hypothetical protein